MSYKKAVKARTSVKVNHDGVLEDLLRDKRWQDFDAYCTDFRLSKKDSINWPRLGPIAAGSGEVAGFDVLVKHAGLNLLLGFSAGPTLACFTAAIEGRAPAALFNVVNTLDETLWYTIGRQNELFKVHNWYWAKSSTPWLKNVWNGYVELAVCTNNLDIFESVLGYGWCDVTAYGWAMLAGTIKGPAIDASMRDRVRQRSAEWHAAFNTKPYTSYYRGPAY